MVRSKLDHGYNPLPQFINEAALPKFRRTKFQKLPYISDMMLRKPYRTDVLPWSVGDGDPTPEGFSSFSRSVRSEGDANGGDYSPQYLQDALMALQRYLPSNKPDVDYDGDGFGREVNSPVDAYSCDHFQMFEFKVRRCARGRSHDWTECPFAHPGEKARRRDPRKYHYCGAACPDFRKGSCKRGDSCEFAHGVFECWLHPARYRTQPCKDGTSCRRRVCFFAHTAEQLRVLPHQSPRSSNAASYSYDGSPLRQAIEASCAKALTYLSSPTISPPLTPQAESPPMSPMAAQSLSRSFGSNPVGEMAASLRNLQLSKVKWLPSAWNIQIGGSPRGSILRPDNCSLPVTPTRASPRPINGGYLDFWEQSEEEEPAMERVESGRDLRAKMFEKLSKENSFNGAHPGSSSATPDVGWISELVQ